MQVLTTFLTAGILAAGGLLASTTTASAEVLTTDFGSDGPTGVGEQPAVPGNISAELDAITNFGVANLGSQPAAFDNTPNLGGQAFVQNGAFYVAGNRAYGFAGEGRSDITFDPDTVSSVTLQVRGSDGQLPAQVSGPGSTTIPGSTVFDEADVTVLIWSELGIELTIDDISNAGFQQIALDVSSLAFAGDAITRISLINNAGAGDNSVALIGSLSVTLVPEPASALIVLGGLAGTTLVRRRR